MPPHDKKISSTFSLEMYEAAKKRHDELLDLLVKYDEAKKLVAKELNEVEEFINYFRPKVQHDNSQSNLIFLDGVLLDLGPTNKYNVKDSWTDKVKILLSGSKEGLTMGELTSQVMNREKEIDKRTVQRRLGNAMNYLTSKDVVSSVLDGKFRRYSLKK